MTVVDGQPATVSIPLVKRREGGVVGEIGAVIASDSALVARIATVDPQGAFAPGLRPATSSCRSTARRWPSWRRWASTSRSALARSAATPRWASRGAARTSWPTSPSLRLSNSDCPFGVQRVATRSAGQLSRRRTLTSRSRFRLDCSSTLVLLKRGTDAAYRAPAMPLIRIVMIAIIGVLVTACGDESSYGADMACEVHVPPNSPTSCGPNTCSAGQFCLAEDPGACARDLASSPDGGGGGGVGGVCINYRCVSLPAVVCDCHAACRSVEGSGEVGCSFDGTTLRCDYV
ncbi:MAG: hypothetical protein JWN44_5118 [Myxococcales bacterium]|nr:hypothetical protein [Myxococcales bacterium]